MTRGIEARRGETGTGSMPKARKPIPLAGAQSSFTHLLQGKQTHV